MLLLSYIIFIWLARFFFMVSKTIEEAKLRLKSALEGVDATLHAQLELAERAVLEAKTARLSLEKEALELRNIAARERTAREHSDSLIARIEPRLDEMSTEILNILKNAGAN